MSSQQLELERRTPFLSARQVAVTAIFGGIAFAFEALNLSIPGYMPGVNFNVFGTWLTLATMIGGPWVGVIVSVIDALAGQVGIIGAPGYAIHALLFALMYKKVYGMKKGAGQVAALWVTSMVALVAQYWYWIFLYAYIFKLMPVGAQIVFHASGPLWIYWVIYSLVPSIVLSTAPKFVSPDWNWTPGKK